MGSLDIRTNGLSSRQEKVLKLFTSFEGALSLDIIRYATGLDSSRVWKTVQTLEERGYIETATKREVEFYRPRKTKVKEALGDRE